MTSPYAAGAAVTATFDDLCLLRSLDVDPSDSRRLTAEELVREINAAPVRAVRPLPLPWLPPGLGRPRSARITDEDVAALVEAGRRATILAQGGAGQEKRAVCSPDGVVTATVTVHSGALVSLDCGHGWLDATPRHDAITEILLTARSVATTGS
jgi:hypothetical protein